MSLLDDLEDEDVDAKPQPSGKLTLVRLILLGQNVGVGKSVRNDETILI